MQIWMKNKCDSLTFIHDITLEQRDYIYMVREREMKKKLNDIVREREGGECLKILILASYQYKQSSNKSLIYFISFIASAG